MIKLVEDVSVLTNVPDTVLKKFIPVITKSIGHCVYETLKSHDETTIIDLGIGELHIKVTYDTIKYRFEPSKDLEKTLLTCVTCETSPLADALEQNLKDKIERTYKELL